MFANLKFLLSLALVAPTFALSLSLTGCKIPTTALSLPSNQTQLVAPSSPPAFVALGFGVQNYTCANTSTYTNVGAIAELFDVSCLVPTPLWSDLPDAAFSAWSELSNITILEIIAALRALGSPGVLGQHYFVPSATGGAPSPKFDFTSGGVLKPNPDAYVISAKAGDIPSPTSPTDVDWLVLNAVQGELADQVFRVDTRGGQPPSSCTPGSPEISVKYAARYFFFGTHV